MEQRPFVTPKTIPFRLKNLDLKPLNKIFQRFKTKIMVLPIKMGMNKTLGS